MNFIICKYLIISSITPPPEKALELPKEWISIGTTGSENMPTSQQVENMLDIVDVQIQKHIYKLHIEDEMKKRYRIDLHD